MHCTSLPAQQPAEFTSRTKRLTRGSGWMVLASALLLSLPSRPVFAQYDTGSIVGIVQDSTGAVIAAAKVNAVNTATGVVYTASSGSSGEYEIPNLHTGTYKVTAERAGFSTAVADNVLVSVGVRQHIDLTLKVGQTATTVEVSDVALQIETETSERGPDRSPTTRPRRCRWSAATSPTFWRPGAPARARRPLPQPPAPSTAWCARAPTTSTASAACSTTSCSTAWTTTPTARATRASTTRSSPSRPTPLPSSKWSPITRAPSTADPPAPPSTWPRAAAPTASTALLYEFIRNTDLNAAGFFKPLLVGNTGPTVPFQKPTFNRNQFGMNFGGPILKDKLFFFLDYEGFRQMLKPLYVLHPADPERDQRDPGGARKESAHRGHVPGWHRDPASGRNQPTFGTDHQLLQAVHEHVARLGRRAPPAWTPTTTPRKFPSPITPTRAIFAWTISSQPSSSWFLRISDRKETGVNYPVHSAAARRQGQRHHPHSRSAGRAWLHAPLRRQQGARCPPRPSSHQGRQIHLSIGHNAFTIPGLQTVPAVIAGGLPHSITSFTAFGRQSTNPQWQDPALLDPKVNFTWVKGKHSLKFGYEYEHIWMAVNDNNPLYGSWTYGGGYSATGTKVADNYWADFLFGPTSSYSVGELLRGPPRAEPGQRLCAGRLEGSAQAYPQPRPALGVRLALLRAEQLHLQLRSCHSDRAYTIAREPSPATASRRSTAAASTARRWSIPTCTTSRPASAFAYAVTPKTAIRGGFGTSYAHYTRAGSGDITGINAPQAQFAAVTQITPEHHQPLHHSASCADHRGRLDHAKLLRHFRPGIPYRPGHHLQPGHRQHHLGAQDTTRQLRRELLPQRAAAVDQEHPDRHRLRRQPRGQSAGLPQRQPENSYHRSAPANVQREYANWPSDITEALNEF